MTQPIDVKNRIGGAAVDASDGARFERFDPARSDQLVSTAPESTRDDVATAVTAGIPVPAFSTALAFFDSYRNPRLPANLLQAQRDYFGAHTYERTDRPRGEFFHIDWPEAGRPQLAIK